MQAEPKAKPARHVHLYLRATPEEADSIRSHAESLGLSVTSYLHLLHRNEMRRLKK